ncbi:glycerol kinase GlpK [Oceanobacter mangrovi]|uniref:glycerol kinase GlpK n=1 Tax=Oceanobacter mangrovi TaxID=2862510 RepID=UPI001C8D2C10|nr:glycerol kinase GlpK [Oceanobacter mangrovi]
MKSAAVKPAVLAIDQGTTSTRAIVFDGDCQIVCSAQQEFQQYYPADGWVEHDPEDLWQSTLKTVRSALSQATELGYRVLSAGITNQRETTLVWQRSSGRAIYNAIVWQDRRTAAECQRLQQNIDAEWLQQRSGLLLDPYFSATKISWILDHVDAARQQADAGELAFGTVDSWLIARFSEGALHLTDATNASRTNLYNLASGDWDDELLQLFRVPRSLLPEVRDCVSDFGVIPATLTGHYDIPLTAVAGDQQAASIGQCCFEAGEIKSTYGTGCFVLLNTGEQIVASNNRLLSTVAWQLDGKRSYALEGSIFIAGAAVQWLRDELGVIQSAAETETLAASLNSNQGVYLVPAFTGLGVPWWQADARGAIVGLTRGAGKAALARAALEAVCYQTADLFDAMAKDGLRPTSLRVDGGMAANNWMLQFLADVLDVPVQRPSVLETTALGVAWLASRYTGLLGDQQRFRQLWQCSAERHPQMIAGQRQELLAGWHKAIERVMC